ncbi:MAG: putative 3-hydroxyacyl-CoA dehydrogenase [Gammaproteobacteria bacterium]|nr:putative 3-hydroxyacyl-CoA dehydrogenase [Gammaproteobacteria bacterium]
MPVSAGSRDGEAAPAQAADVHIGWAGLQVRAAAVLGAGVMGAQIAAHLANAGIETLLFDLPEAGDPRGLARRAIAGLAAVDPPPLAGGQFAARIRPCGYDTDAGLLQDCDLLIEAIAERLDLKIGLLRRIAPSAGPQTVLATNTSGLSIEAMADALPRPLRARFCGIHFFNPPRYMRLVELVPCGSTDRALLDAIETFLVMRLGKGVIRARNTPNFIGNRIGIAALAMSIHHADRHGLRADLADALSGAPVGRPKSATFRTVDIIGLDTYAHVLEGPSARLAGDPWVAYFTLAPWLRELIGRGALGRKAGRGIYRKAGDAIEVYDRGSGGYVRSGAQAAAEVETILRMADPWERLAGLRACTHPQARYLWSIQRDVLHYAAVHLAGIADSARDVDLAMRWGFGWRHGPFEIWQAAGWRRVARLIEADIAAGEALARIPLPGWVHEIADAHNAGGSWSPGSRRYLPRPALKVYTRQRYPEPLCGEPAPPCAVIFENASARLWRAHDDVAVLSFNTRLNVINAEILESMHRAVDLAERGFAGLVIWQFAPPFSAGADLKEFNAVMRTQGLPGVEAILRSFQGATRRLRDAQVPTVAAVRDLALGGACEVMMHCARTVACTDSRIGLVETGVGVLPAAGGCKEMARRVVAGGRGCNPLEELTRVFGRIMTARRSGSAEQARDFGYLRETDLIIMNPGELLHVAVGQARALAEAGYHPPCHAPIPVCGRDGMRRLNEDMRQALASGRMTEHDAYIGLRVALALTGGEIEPGTLVAEDALLDIERRGFLELLQHPRTQARIHHTLTTGEALRN